MVNITIKNLTTDNYVIHMNSNQDMWVEGMTPKISYRPTLYQSTKVHIDWPSGFPLVK